MCWAWSQFDLVFCKNNVCRLCGLFLFLYLINIQILVTRLQSAVSNLSLGQLVNLQGKYTNFNIICIVIPPIAHIHFLPFLNLRMQQ